MSTDSTKKSGNTSKPKTKSSSSSKPKAKSSSSSKPKSTSKSSSSSKPKSSSSSSSKPKTSSSSKAKTSSSSKAKTSSASKSTSPSKSKKTTNQGNNRPVRLISRLPYSKGVAFDESFAIPNWQKFFAKHYEWANKHPRTTDFLAKFYVDYESIGGKWFFFWSALAICGAVAWILCWFLQLMTPATMPLDRFLNTVSGLGKIVLFVAAVFWAINWILNWTWPFIANAFSNQEDDDIDEDNNKKKSAKDFFADTRARQKSR